MTRILPGSFVLAFLGFATAFAQAEVERIDSGTDRSPLHTVIPDYPNTARRDRIEGEVQVCFDISREGYAQRIAVRRSSNRVFEKPARKAVRKSSWTPLESHEALPGIKACRTFRFSLVPVEETPDQS